MPSDSSQELLGGISLLLLLCTKTSSLQRDQSFRVFGTSAHFSTLDQTMCVYIYIFFNCSDLAEHMQVPSFNIYSHQFSCIPSLLKPSSHQPFPIPQTWYAYLRNKTSTFFCSVPALASGHEQVQAYPDSNVICKTEQLQPRLLNRNGNCYWFPKHRGCAPHLHDKSVSKDWGLRGNSLVCKHELVVYINTIYSTTSSMVKSRKIQEESATCNQRHSQQKNKSLIQVQLNSAGKGKSRHTRVQRNYRNLWITTKFLIKMKKRKTKPNRLILSCNTTHTVINKSNCYLSSDNNKL